MLRLARSTAARPRAGRARPRPDRSLARTTAVLAAVALLGAGCGGGSSKSSGAPVLRVATGLWPLAEVAEVIGQGNVSVDDVVPAGNDPGGYHLTAAQSATVGRADVAIDTVGDLQPSFTAAARRAKRTVAVAGADGNPYVWLNPDDMEAVGRQIAQMFDVADPKAKPTFSTGLANLEAELGSLDDDYQSTLSTCPDRTLVTITDAFGVLHPRYPVVDLAVAPDAGTGALPSPADVKRQISAIKATGTNEIYNESWVPLSDIFAATTATHVKVGTLDTLAGPPGAGWVISPQGSKYVSLMEENLGAISSALRCPNPAES